MGRHSAPDDDSPDAADAVDDAATLTLTWDAAASAGRHAVAHHAEPMPDVPDAHGVTADEQETLIIPVDRARVEPQPERVHHKAVTRQDRADRKAAARRARLERKRARWERGSRADLRMLRQNTAVRVQCIVVIAIAFGGYSAVMFGLGRDSRGYLLWVWIPIVISGVLVGACLDLAHRRVAKQSASAEPGPGKPDDARRA